MGKRYDVRVVLSRDGERFEIWLGSVAREVVAAAVGMLRADAQRYGVCEAYKALRERKER